MRISTSTATARLTRPRTASGGTATASRFALPSPSAAKSEGLAPAAPLTSLSAVLAVQEAGDPTERRRRAIQRGSDLLDRLDEVHLALAGGGATDASLARLSGILDDAGDSVDDPQLQDVLDDIDLRASVEIAKGRRDD